MVVEREIKRYRLPTHLKVADKLTIGWFSFSFRQLAILVVGGGLIYDLWQHLSLPLPWVSGVRVGLAVLLSLVTLGLAYVRIKGRTLDGYLWIRFAYWSQPTCYTWRQRSDPALVPGRVPKPKTTRGKERGSDDESDQQDA